MESIFYNGTKLLNTKDINGDTPGIYMCCGNRSAGKTTYFNRYVVNRFKKHKEKFMLLYRYKEELNGVAEKFFKDINGLFFQKDIMESEKRENGIYHNLYLNDNHCGYAAAINSADRLRKLSHFFSDTKRMLFDEFQSESNNYVPKEIIKFRSIYTTVARGQGEQIRNVPMIMLSNAVTLLNPYFQAFGISSRLQKNTKFLRGEGYVLEFTLNEHARDSMKESAFNRAFKDQKYLEFASENVYLDDNTAFIDTPKGNNRYMGTIVYEGVNYGLRAYDELGIIYVSDKFDATYPFKIAVTTEDHNINYVMLKKNDNFIVGLRWYFEKGCFRFKNLQSKQAILTALSYY